ncbi:MAG: hypothetical protein ACPKM0_01645 [Pleomorphochaeta sp.]
MDAIQLSAIDIAAKGIVNRFGAVELNSITNKIHPDLKGVKASSIHKVLKETESSEYVVKDDVLKIIYFDITYDRTDEVLKAKDEYKEWNTITWEDIEPYIDTYDLPLCEKAQLLFNYCCSINKDLVENKQLFAFRFSNYVNTHKIISKCSITKFILEPFKLPTWDIELEALIIDAIYNQTSWLCYGRCRNERVKYAWIDKAISSVEKLTETEFNTINQLAQAATNFYGVISLKNFHKLLKLYYKEIKISRDELNELLNAFNEESNIFYFNKHLVTDRIYDWSFDLFKDETIRKIDPESFDKYKNNKNKQTSIAPIDTNLITEYSFSVIRQMQEQKKLLVLSKNELLKYLDISHVKETENYKYLENYYINIGGKYKEDMTRFRIIFNRYVNNCGDNSPNIIRHFFLATGFSDHEEANVEHLLLVVQKAFNEAPRWLNNGFSAMEIKGLAN